MASMASGDIPEDILLMGVLPYLSAKSLCRCKGVSKRWRSNISFDGRLLVEQQSRRPSSTSYGAVYSSHGPEHGSLAFLPTLGSPVGVPDPSLGFHDASRFELLASANGLLCLHIRDGAQNQSFLYVCNPATKKGECVPESAHRGCRSGDWASIGLAFDPIVEPSHYTLVHLLWSNSVAGIDGVNGLQYEFDVFSSHTGQWVRSSERLVIKNFLSIHTKVVFVRGVLYWDCWDRIIYYHLADNRAGTMMLPHACHNGAVRAEQEIGVWDDKLTFTKVDKEAVEVWVLAGDLGVRNWVKKHEIKLEAMIAQNMDVFSEFWHTMSKRRRTVSDELTDRHMVRPLPYEGGGRLFLRMRIGWKVGKDRLFCYDMATGEMEEFDSSCCGLSEFKERPRKFKERSRKFKERSRENFFSYHNSLVQLPKIT